MTADRGTMTAERGTTPALALSNGIRVALGVSGIIAVILGILILAAPLKTASLISGILALYAIVTGLVYAGIAIFSKKLGGWKRIGHGILALMFLVVGGVAFSDLGNATTIIATVVALIIGIAWIVEGVVALTTIADAANRIWVAVYAAISLGAGIVALIAPFSFAAALWLVLGISLIMLGVVQIIRGFAFNASRLIAGA